MKKFISAALITTLALGVTACSSAETTADSGDTDENVTIKIGATSVPHAELLALVEDDLAEEGINLEVEEFSEYTIINQALVDGDLDANYFQTQPYLDTYNEDHGTDLVSVGGVHLEPMRIYSETLTDISELPDGATISIPNDASNEGRALLLLEDLGLITVDESVGLYATPKDVIDNPKNLEFLEIDSYMLPRNLEEVDAAIINTNVALEAGLGTDKSIAVEESEGSPYANIVVTTADRADDPDILAVVDALQSEEVETYINETYDGAVVPAFED